MNNFDINLNFTEDSMIDNQLIFLDMCLYLDSSKNIQIRQHRKSTSVVLNNFEQAVMPRSQKISTLTGEIFRAKYCSSTNSDLNKALSNLKSIFIKNQYPEKLISNKISEIKNRNFTPKTDKTKKQQELRESQHRSFNLVIPYTSHQCSKIGMKMIKLFKRFTPSFKLQICWKNIRISDQFSKKLKLAVPFIEKAGTIYKMTCVKPCSQEYIGESKRPLHIRINEHGDPNREPPTAIRENIENCTHFQSELSRQFGMTLYNTVYKIIL